MIPDGDISSIKGPHVPWYWQRCTVPGLGSRGMTPGATCAVNISCKAAGRYVVLYVPGVWFAEGVLRDRKGLVTVQIPGEFSTPPFLNNAMMLYGG